MDTASLLIRMTSALAIILGLMAAMVIVLKRWGAMGTKAKAGYIQVIENRMLLPKRHLSLVRVAGTYFLIGSTEHGMSLIGRVNRDEMETFDQLVQESGKEERREN